MNAARDWTTLPLGGDGRSLVEASAGTGKTWTIAVLYLRLLLEQRLSPRQIVVSTFTNAAAAELGERLRGKLLWALAEADKHLQGVASVEAGHPDRDWIHSRWRHDGSSLDADVKRLQGALTEFDAAPVSTLHALCSRILADHPFAAGALFRGREMVDGKILQAALADDLWRVIAQGREGDPLVELASAVRLKDSGAGELRRLARKDLDKYVPILLQPNVVVDPIDRSEVVDALARAVGDHSAWAADARTVLSTAGLVNRNRRLPKAWLALADAIEATDGDLAAVLAEYRMDLLAAPDLGGVNAAGKDHPLVLRLAAQSPRIAICMDQVALDRAGDVALRRFLAAARQWCLQAMQARLDAANQSTFDQLLWSVRSALQPVDGHRALADALFAAWPVALVDEFQDTDPVQFAILDEIYRTAHGAPRGRLVMIGDPKQAIYRFRGGDVQAYERAKAAVPEADRLALAINHRSSRGYVEAINQFYAVAGTRLGPADSDTGIAYAEVGASDRRDRTPLRAAASHTPVGRPLVLHEISAEDEAADGDAAELEYHALRVCAAQVVRALAQDGYRIGERALAPGDIAVLLPSHRQITRLASLLKARGVPCVVSSLKSVFESDTARELRLVLYAALHADDPRAVRAALATRLCGASLRDLQALRHDAAGWEREAVRFHALRDTLQRLGPLGLVTALMDEHAPRWMQGIEGERMLTDLRHLGELLQEAWVECGGGERLAAWFARQMDEGGDDADAGETRALRLESDAARVKLMTLHASKGLEFGVVFLPLMWKHAGVSRGARLLAFDDGACKYLVEGEHARNIVKRQEFEERYRILYVALTRAIHACHLFVLPADVRARQRRLGEVALNRLDLARLREQSTAVDSRIAFEAGWQEHPGSSWNAGGASTIVRAARALPAAPTGPLPMRHSFSRLTGGARQRVAEEDGAAEDEALVEQAMEETMEPADDTAPAAGGSLAPVVDYHADLDALSALAGADFGNAVHALFEHRLPGRMITPDQALAALREHGVRPREGEPVKLAAALADRLNRVLQTPLAAGSGPRLADLGAADARAEMEFNYLLDGVSMRALREACERHGEPDMVPRREQSLAGLMNGKIDLLFAHGGRFHVLDYKGNQLARGARACLQDYGPAALEAKMAGTGYRFQALLYTVAVERYLRERLGAGYRREQHLGDCWYLFIRAVGLQLPDGTACGVWRYRFDDGLLDAVQAVLGAAQREEAA